MEPIQFSKAMEKNSNWSFVEAAIQELLAPKTCFYSLQDLYKTVASFPLIKCESLEVTQGQQKFTAYHIQRHKDNPSLHLPCVIYLHGLSSFAMEGSYLIPHVTPFFSLCLYDLRGHGKNLSPKVTYGLKEAEDLRKLIETLTNQYQVEEFYLWGRSMGAATCLQLLSSAFKHGNANFYSKIKGVVLDSAFSSFSKIAEEMISCNAHLPQFIASIIVSSGFNTIEQQHYLNFNSLDFTGLQHVKCPAVFVYSENDEIVKPHHSELIMISYGGPIMKFKQKFTHNENRPISLILKIMENLTISLRKRPSQGFSRALTPKKPIGLSLSISQSNSARKLHKTYTPVKSSHDLFDIGIADARMKDLNYSSAPYNPKLSISRKKHPKLRTTKKLIEDASLEDTPKRMEIFKPNSIIPDRNRENIYTGSERPVIRKEARLECFGNFEVPFNVIHLPMTNRRYR